jgi:hypothetical protein
MTATPAAQKNGVFQKGRFAFFGNRIVISPTSLDQFLFFIEMGFCSRRQPSCREPTHSQQPHRAEHLNERSAVLS